MTQNKKYSHQQLKKLLYKKCFFCEESDYNLLDVHRILEGCKGGKYVHWNTICCCSKCHRKIHSLRIKIIGKHPSTSGRWVINYIEDGEEKWVAE